MQIDCHSVRRSRARSRHLCKIVAFSLLFVSWLIPVGCFKVKYTMTSPSKTIVVKVLESCMYVDCGVRLRLLSGGVESELAGRTDCDLEFATAAWVARSNAVVILVKNNYCDDIFMAYDTVARQETALEPYMPDFERHLRKEFRLSDANLTEYKSSAIAWALDSNVGEEVKMHYRQDK